MDLYKKPGPGNKELAWTRRSKKAAVLMFTLSHERKERKKKNERGEKTKPKMMQKWEQEREPLEKDLRGRNKN